MNHKELCNIGARWVLNVINWRFRCNYIVTEFVALCREQPDIFGLMGSNHTLLIEVKVSRNDFLNEKKKQHRRLNGIGSQRYYLCPAGLIKESELPEKWGLLYCDDGKITVIKESEHFTERNIEGEMSIMYSIIRRLSKKRQVLNFRDK